MFIAEVPGSYISGVFKEAEEFRKYVNEIPDELLKKQRMYHVDMEEYPLFMLEEERKYAFFSKEEWMREDLEKRIENKDDEDYNITAYYITEDYRPPEAGKDSMGLLNHEHFCSEDN